LLKTLLAAAAATALLSGTALAQDRAGGLYGRLDIGAGVAGDVDFNAAVTGPEGSGTLPFNSSSDLDVGWQGGVALGLQEFPLPNWRTELEGVYTNNETDDGQDNFDDVFDTGDEGEDVDTASADVNVWGGFLNLIYDIPTGTNWRPYIGGGVGYGRVEVDYDNADGEDEVFLWQAKAGLSYALSDNVDFEFGYRFLDAESAAFEEDDVDLTVSGEVDTQLHSVTAGLRYRFGG
jgi:opacity protein-like surface antigen